MGMIEDSKLDHQLLAGTEQIKQFLGANVVSDSPLELDRITRYALFWKFYEGKHYRDHNDGMLAFNYVRAFIDKINMFLLGNTGCTWKMKSLYNAIVAKDVERLAEEFLNYHWAKNKKPVLLYEMLQMGGITGDLWCSATWVENKSFVRIQTLDSRQCFPTFVNGDYNNLESFMVRQPLQPGNKDKFTTFVQRYTEVLVESWYQKDAKSDDSSTKYQHNKVENPYGFIPIIHVKNKTNSSGYYSTSDASDILKLNKVYNELNQEIKGIIDYYGTPTTVITGASAKTLKRGLGNIWSGLPSEANVFNLGLDVDLGAATGFAAQIKTSMHELSDVPENALGKLQAISNTSAAALQLTFQPLIQQANMKGLTYGEGIVELNEMIFKITFYHRPDDERLAQLLQINPKFVEEMRAEPVWGYGFPQDRMVMLQEIDIESRLNVASKVEIMNRLGKENVPDLIREIRLDAIRAARTQAITDKITGASPDGSPADPNAGNQYEPDNTTDENVDPLENAPQ